MLLGPVWPDAGVRNVSLYSILHPILALDHGISEYRDYLHSEFRAKDGRAGFRSRDSGGTAGDTAAYGLRPREPAPGRPRPSSCR